MLKKGVAKSLEEDKELRIDNQYYLKNRPVTINFNELRDFILEMKELMLRLTNDNIAEIRNKMKGLL